MRDSALIALHDVGDITNSSYAYSVVHSSKAHKHIDQSHGLDHRGLGARLELVGQATLAAVLAVLVHGHLHIILLKRS